jgi:hypothetical protein
VPVSPLDAVAAGNGVPFLVSAGIVYEIIAANCSSPQTAEINADARAATLMKWVYVGLIQSAAFVAIAATVDRPHAKPILAGGGMAAVVMYASYRHGLASGLNSTAPGTES